MKIVSVVGARPQFIKAAVVSRALRERPDVHESILHTGQHYDANMSEVFFQELDIPRPEHTLDVGSASHGAQTGRMLEKIEHVLLQERPDWVLVYGDTNSTLAGALAAVKLHIGVAHVEAGLRSFNRQMPEEINRVVVDHVSTMLFPPTEAAVAHLAREGLVGKGVRLVGDVMYDAALYYAKRAESHSSMLKTLGCSHGQYVLATVHRAENTDKLERLQAIVEALEDVSKLMPVIFPVHPRTKVHLSSGHAPKSLRLIDPVGYLDMVALETNAALIVTDSGGVQKEAFFYGVPCCTLRDETEWTELIELGWNRLVPPREPQAMSSAIRAAVGTRGREGQPFGGGDAGQNIAHALAGSTN